MTLYPNVSDIFVGRKTQHFEWNSCRKIVPDFNDERWKQEPNADTDATKSNIYPSCMYTKQQQQQKKNRVHLMSKQS